MIDPRSIEGSPERAPLPPPGAPWHEVEAWCATIASPAGDPRSIDELAAIARQVEVDMSAATVDDLLSSAYVLWRSARWNDGNDPEARHGIGAVIEELRRRIATLRPR